jgi:CHASE3 domain sensor protein
VTGLGGLLAAPGPIFVLGEPENRKSKSKPHFRASPQRLILGVSFAVLAVISAAAIALDVKSRSDMSWTQHTMEVSKKLTDLRLLFRNAESAVRGYLLNDDPSFAAEYRQHLDGIKPAFEVLTDTLGDNPAQLQLLADCERLVIRRFAVASEMVRLHAAGDSTAVAALSARGDGRLLMLSINADFDQLVGDTCDRSAVRRLDPDTGGDIRVGGEAFEPEA